LFASFNASGRQKVLWASCARTNASIVIESIAKPARVCFQPSPGELKAMKAKPRCRWYEVHAGGATAVCMGSTKSACFPISTLTAACGHKCFILVGLSSIYR
jgi:hypothetical protein